VRGEVRVVKLERLPIRGPAEDPWYLRPGSRSRGWLWFEPQAVPFVDATEAYFEIERVRGGWRVVRQVEQPAYLRQATLPAVDPDAAWPRHPRTLGELRREGRSSFRSHCACREERAITVAQVCRAFDGWTIEELQRAGFWRCGCGRMPAIGVYAPYEGVIAYVERWPLEGQGWVRV
jgi:hypothetical protein